jgi:hypothetical protein
MDRYQDGIDLAKGTILINYIRPGDETPTVKVAVASNAEYSTNKIRFGWLIDSYVTEHPGIITFEIEVIGTLTQQRYKYNEDNQSVSLETTSNTAYVWKTQSNSSLQVIQSLGEGSGTIDLPENWESIVTAAVATGVTS